MRAMRCGAGSREYAANGEIKYRKGGGGFHAKFGVAIYGAEKICHQFFSNATEKFGMKIPHCETTSIDHGLWLLFPMGVWLVVVFA